MFLSNVTLVLRYFIKETQRLTAFGYQHMDPVAVFLCSSGFVDMPFGPLRFSQRIPFRDAKTVKKTNQTNKPRHQEETLCIYPTVSKSEMELHRFCNNLNRLLHVMQFHSFSD